MKELKTDQYGPLARELLAQAWSAGRPRTLEFAAPAEEFRAQLQSMDGRNISNNRRVRMPHDAEALKAALWLLFDFKEESHAISQSLATPSGSYWHGILHRREPDADNARYWMARVGEHPIFPDLFRDAREIAAAAGAAGAPLLKELDAHSAWDAAWFAARCAGAADPLAAPVLLDLQRREWQLLFDYNFTKAFA